MEVQLSVICVWVYPETATSSNCYNVSTVNQEKYRSKGTALRDTTRQEWSGRHVPCNADSLGAVMQEWFNPRQGKTSHTKRRCSLSVRMSWSPMSKAAERYIFPKFYQNFGRLFSAFSSHCLGVVNTSALVEVDETERRDVYTAQTSLEWMNEFISLTKHTISQAGTPRHDNCVDLPVS